MSIDDETLGEALRRKGVHGEAASEIRRILTINEKNDRVDKVLADGGSPADYVERLIVHYLRWHEHVDALQVAKAADVWEPFYVTLQKWAHAFLARRGFSVPGARAEHASACAAEAAAVILDTHFPFDVHFERWAYVILQHTCLRRIDAHWNSSDALHNNPVPLDEFDGWIGNLAASGAVDEVDRVGLHHDLLDAISELASDARQRFIILFYFQHRSFDEISDLMQRPKSALYKLHFDALENLREIWWGKQDNHE